MDFFVQWHHNVLFFIPFLTVLCMLFSLDLGIWGGGCLGVFWGVFVGTEHQADIFTEPCTTVPSTWQETV